MEPHNFEVINKNNRIVPALFQISIDHVKCNRKFPVFRCFVTIDTLCDPEIESVLHYKRISSRQRFGKITVTFLLGGVGINE